MLKDLILIDLNKKIKYARILSCRYGLGNVAQMQNTYGKFKFVINGEKTIVRHLMLIAVNVQCSMQ